MESVPEIDPRAGFFYREPTDTHLDAAIEQFEQEEPNLSPAALRAYAARFSEKSFRREMSKILFDCGPKDTGGNLHTATEPILLTGTYK